MAEEDRADARQPSRYTTPSCPACQQMRATVLRIAVGASEPVFITLRCEACAHEWTIQRPHALSSDFVIS